MEGGGEAKKKGVMRTNSHMNASIAEDVESRAGHEARSEHKHLATPWRTRVSLCFVL